MSAADTKLNHDALALAPDDDSRPDDTDGTHWKILIVDDDPEIHSVTKLALEEFTFEGSPIEFLSAFSAAEARELLRTEHKDIALTLLDVVMETDDAGLKLAQYIRDELNNHLIRIILRTGHPGIAPEREVITRYEINDYRSKTELTQARMFSVVYTALSSYRHLRALFDNERRLQRAVEELEEFAYVTAHDLQSPIRGIVGFAQLLQRRYAEGFDQGGKDFLANIVASATHMQTLISDLLEFARVGRDHIERQPVACGEVMTEALRNLDAAIRASGAVIDSGDLPTVSGNRTLLVQLFQNLIGNGIKFRSPQRTPEIRVRAEREETTWHFTVTDNGIGIKADNQQRIFQVFQRLHTQDEIEGTGIGLAICRKVVTWHGGEIWLESEPGEGSVFHFTLPAQPPARA